MYDFTSSGLTHVNEEYPKAPNRHRVAGPFVDLNFGLVEIHWKATPSPMITMKTVGLDGRAVFEDAVSLDLLQTLHDREM